MAAIQSLQHQCFQNGAKAISRYLRLENGYPEAAKTGGAPAYEGPGIFQLEAGGVVARHLQNSKHVSFRVDLLMLLDWSQSFLLSLKLPVPSTSTGLTIQGCMQHALKVKRYRCQFPKIVIRKSPQVANSLSVSDNSQGF